ncbi:AtpZ/AtpI family protein [uncultured Desulfobulbus sp.]|uniref:AtpZ/AtpI family protein n=1 Tax=uncultured Desulfobulbus sp. TaxID=239745 RepID=UPI0026130854|nr:AtpZ/AtpI family protein [uncultured Desulfobulbus sp.]
MSEDRREMFRQLAIYSHVGMTFVFSILVGFGMGWLLDNKVFNGRTAPYLTFVFLGLGIIAGFRQLWELTRTIKDD